MLTLAQKPCTGSPLKMGRTMIMANTAPKDSQKPPSYRLSGLHKRTDVYKRQGVSLKDSICYVNLDEGFLNNAYVLNPRLTVYSIVNSVIDGGNSSRVQISINGESDRCV